MRLMVERAPSTVRRGKPALQRVSRKQTLRSRVWTRRNAEVRLHPRLTHGTRNGHRRRDQCQAEQDSSPRPEHRFYNPSAAHPLFAHGPSTTLRAGPRAFALGVDQAPVSWTPWRSGRLLARHDRDDLVGLDGGAGGSASAAERPAQRRQGAHSGRRCLGPRHRLRARQTRLRLAHPRSPRSRRRPGVDRAARHRAHRDRRRASGLHLRRGAARQCRRMAHPLHAHRRAELLQRARRRAADLSQRSRWLVLLLRRYRGWLAVERAREAARGESRSHRPHQ
jgi:hypothetical protein